jgi:ABC-type amino acid transport substrate-binding protein
MLVNQQFFKFIIFNISFRCFFSLLIVAIIFLIPINTVARDLTVSLPERAGLAELDREGKISGSLVELVKAIDDVYDEGKIIIIGVYPFKRSIRYVINGKADFQPINIKGSKQKGFIYSSVRITVLSDVLYTNSDTSPLDKNNLWKYQINVGRGHGEIFRNEFLKRFKRPAKNIQEITTVRQGLLMVSAGRSEGFLMDMDSGDAVLRKLKLRNIRRELYRQRDVHAIMHPGIRGKEVDRILTKAFSKLRKQGRLKNLVNKLQNPGQNGNLTKWAGNLTVN